MRLHADDRVLLRIESLAAIVDFDANQVLVDLVAVALKCLFGNELQKAASLGSARELFALQNSAQLLSLLKQ